MKSLRWLALIVGLQATWLLGTAFTAQRHLSAGRIIRVETVPVDPRDLLRGDFVVLRYDFSRIPPDRLEPRSARPGPSVAGSEVYVELAPEGGLYHLVKATWGRPSVPAEHVLLRGRITRVDSPSLPTAGTVWVDYGLERFFVREGTGQPRGKLTVDVSVSDDGIGMIKEVFLDGVRYSQAMREQR